MKPNREELAEAVGWPLVTMGDALSAAQALHGKGAHTVLASLGADGALLITGGTALHGSCDVPIARSSVGAGDSMLAGFLAAGADGEPALAAALQWAAAAVGMPGSGAPGPRQIARYAAAISDDIDTGHVLGT